MEGTYRPERGGVWTPGLPVVWMHGTPGARRQVPVEARRYAAGNGLRIIGIDRLGVGSMVVVAGRRG